MALKDYIAVIRARWISVVVMVVIGLVLAEAATIATTPDYRSTTRLFVSTPAATESGELSQGAAFSIQRVKSYAALITGEELAQRVVDKLKLPESARELLGHISAEVEPETVVLRISVTDGNPEQARRIAETTATEFISYITSLETPSQQDDSPIKVSIIDPAELPAGPYTPNVPINLAAGFIFGLILGLAIALMRELLDNRIDSEADLDKALHEEVPVLGVMSQSKSAANDPMAQDIPDNHPRLEAFRVLRTNLRFVDTGAGTPVFVITSPSQGDGKSTISTNIARVCADAGQRVLLVEGDLRRPSLANYLSLVGEIGLSTVLAGQASLDDVVQTVRPGLDAILSGKRPPNPSELLTSQYMRKFIDEAKASYDIIIIDAPPILPVADGAILAAAADGALLVVRHNTTTIEQLRGSVDRLHSVDARLRGVIVSMAPSQRADSSYGFGLDLTYTYEMKDAPKRRRDK